MTINLEQILREALIDIEKKTSSRRELTAEEAKCLAKLEAIAGKLKRGEHVQNRQLQTWLSGAECAATDAAATYLA